MHCSNFSDRIYVEKTPKQKAREDAWEDIYSSVGLDDEQVYDGDDLEKTI